MAIDPVPSAIGAYTGAPVPGASQPTPKEVVESAATAEPRKAEAVEAPIAQEQREKLKDVLDKLNIVLNSMDIQLKFSIHEQTHQTMVKVVNMETGRVIREIPPKRTLDMLAKMQELAGLLLDERA